MRYITFSISLFSIVFSSQLKAQWTHDSSLNTLIAGDTSNKVQLSACSDGSGGAILTWSFEYKGVYDYNIAAQKVSSGGQVKWSKQGKFLCTDFTSQQYPTVASDGNGGGFFAWTDSRPITQSELYFQKVNGLGALSFATNGQSFVSSSYSKGLNVLLPDGSGGVFVIWVEKHSSTAEDIYAQHLSSSGTKLWTTTGVPICTATGTQTELSAVLDGEGGFIVTWQDERNYSTQKTDIYAQKINSSGVVQWSSDGALVSSSIYAQEFPKICSDGKGGAFICWEENNAGVYCYYQRIKKNGTTLWGNAGKSVQSKYLSTATGNLAIISDGKYGVIFSWVQGKTSNDIWAQRLDSAGAGLWTDTGVAAYAGSGEQSYPNMVLSSTGSPIIAWWDKRNGSNYDIYAQILDANGNSKGSSQGIPISVASNDQAESVIVSDGNGGAIIAWRDFRNGKFWDVYAQRINSLGQAINSPAPEIDIQGKGISIVSGNVTPSSSNGTDFGTVTLPNTASSTFEILNTGNDTLEIDNIYLNGGDDFDFTLPSISLPKKLSKGQKLSFTVTFEPFSAGTKSTTLVVENTDPDEYTYTFALKGVANSKVGINTVKNPDNLLVFMPNPTSQKTILVLPEDNICGVIHCYRLDGTKCDLPYDQDGNKVSLDLLNVSAGMYFIELFTENRPYSGWLTVVK